MKLARRSTAVVLASCVGVVALAIGQTPPIPEPPAGAPPSLKDAPRPRPSNLAEFIADETAAIQLGKAFFWDMQIGSDNATACATCHFNAGADSRSINQMNPGKDGIWHHGPNLPLQASHFPLRRLTDSTDRASAPAYDVNDVVASQGVFNMEFVENDSDSASEIVLRPFDPMFSVAGLNVRRVEPRNTPSVINAVFNYRNFWDGRAQNEFNGVDNWGDRNPNARVYKAVNNKDAPTAVAVRLLNSSLASQAVAPILSPDEMAASGRDSADLGGKIIKQRGKKLALNRPLALQRVHPEDSVLGALSRWPDSGLSVQNYETLIRKAFKREWWDSKYSVRVESNGTVKVFKDKKPKGSNEYTLIEYNFGLFFGIALQLYQATLVSDDTPYDRWVRREPGATISPEAFTGLQVFISQNKVLPDGTVLVNQGGRCVNCHSGPELTDAAVSRITNPDPTNGTIRRIREGQEIDRGFNNIGVRPTSEDRGVGGTDSFGKPLSATALCRQQTNPQPPCPPTGTLFIATDGAFKAPGLRNVELTAPYFHNGGHHTLESVMEFYSRGGDLAPLLASDGTTAIRPLGIPAESAPLHGFPHGFSSAEKAGLVAFMKSLTDERVRYRKAPFDHPELYVPNGQMNDNVTTVADSTYPTQAKDRVLLIEAVGKNGGNPLPRFLDVQ